VRTKRAKNRSGGPREGDFPVASPTIEDGEIRYDQKRKELRRKIGKEGKSSNASILATKNVRITR